MSSMRVGVDFLLFFAVLYIYPKLELFWQENTRRNKMENPFVIIVWFLGTTGILSVLGIIGILIKPLLKDKEQPQT